MTQVYNHTSFWLVFVGYGITTPSGVAATKTYDQATNSEYRSEKNLLKSGLFLLRASRVQHTLPAVWYDTIPAAWI